MAKMEKVRRRKSRKNATSEWRKKEGKRAGWIAKREALDGGGFLFSSASTFSLNGILIYVRHRSSSRWVERGRRHG